MSYSVSTSSQSIKFPGTNFVLDSNFWDMKSRIKKKRQWQEAYLTSFTPKLDESD